MTNQWQEKTELTYGGRVPVGVVDTCVVTLVDPLPEDGASNGLVGQQQSYHLGS